jgi:hypothetical protein
VTADQWKAYLACTTPCCRARDGEPCRHLRTSYRPGFDTFPARGRPHIGRLRRSSS